MNYIHVGKTGKKKLHPHVVTGVYLIWPEGVFKINFRPYVYQICINHSSLGCRGGSQGGLELSSVIEDLKSLNIFPMGEFIQTPPTLQCSPYPHFPPDLDPILGLFSRQTRVQSQDNFAN